MFEDYFEIDIEQLSSRFKDSISKGTSFFATDEEFEYLINYYFNQGMFSLVDKAVEKSLILYPVSSRLWHLKGFVFFKTKKYNEALIAFKNAYVFNKEDAENALFIALTYIELDNIHQSQKFFAIAADLLANEESEDPYNVLLQGSEIIYSHVISGDDNPFLIDNKFGQKELLKIDLAEALFNSVEDIEDNAFNAQKSEYLALCYALKGKLKKSKKELEKAIKIDPFNFDRWLYYGLLDYRLKNYNDALESIEYSLSVFPENPEALYIKGSILFMLQDYSKALETYQELLSYDLTEESEIYLNMGKCYECINDYMNATSYYLKSYENDKENAKALINLGGMFLELHDLEMAHHYLFLASKIDKDNAELQYTFADLMLHKGNLAKGIRYINKALAQIPDEVDFILLQSELYQAKNNIHKSIQILKNALKNNDIEEKARFYFRLAGLHILNQNIDEAYHYLKTAISEDPKLMPNFLDSFPEAKKYNIFKGLLNLPEN